MRYNWLIARAILFCMPPEEILRSQIAHAPTLEHGEHLVVSPRVLVAGLGGSRLAGAFLRDLLPDVKIELHSGFDAPRHAAFAGSSMIASSTSGDTAETISAYGACGEQGMSRSVVTRGGALLDMAKRDRVPYVIMPQSTLPPRETLVHSLLGHCHLLGQPAVATAICRAVERVSTHQVGTLVDAVVPSLQGKSILLYAPDELESLLRYIKVNLNETARVPAYIGLLPEILHGEIAVLEGGLHGPKLSEQIAILLIHTEDTDARILARMRALTEVVSPKGIAINTLQIPGRSWDSVASGAQFALVLAHRLREYGALVNGGENMIGAFKKIMQKQTP